MDPYDNYIDPVNPALLNARGGMDLPVTTGPNQVSSLSGQEPMSVLGTAAVVAGIFAGTRRYVFRAQSQPRG